MIGATVKTAPDSPAQSGANSFTAATAIQKDVQSSIVGADLILPNATDSSCPLQWKLDPANSRLTAQWVNSDKSKPQTFFGYLKGANSLLEPSHMY